MNTQAIKWIGLLLAWLLVAGCVTVSAPDATDLSSTKVVNVDGLKFKIPRYYKKFNENGASVFRPEPPVRPSPGVLVFQEETADSTALLGRAMLKVRDKMSGNPLAIKATIDGRECLGLTDELLTHFIRIYVVEGKDAIWLLQIVAPLTWSDAQAIALHDMVVESVRITH